MDKIARPSDVLSHFPDPSPPGKAGMGLDPIRPVGDNTHGDSSPGPAPSSTSPNPMPVPIDCPKCGTTQQIADSMHDQVVHCEQCGGRIEPAPPSRYEPPASSTESLTAASPMPDEEMPASIGRYQVIRLLGHGAIGAVYLAKDPNLDRLIALKIPRDRQRPNRERFLREAHAAARLHHANICPIFDSGEYSYAEGVDNKIPYLAMAYIAGETLADVIGRDRRWETRRSVEMALTLALAVAHAHDKGVIHRDIKPANVMVDGLGQLILMDFGLARRIDSADPTFTTADVPLGTPHYMPPEQAKGQIRVIGPRSDIYSLGVILYEVLAGRRPFEGRFAWEVMAQVVNVEPSVPSAYFPGVDPAIEAIVIQAMAKEPRWPLRFDAQIRRGPAGLARRTPATRDGESGQNHQFDRNEARSDPGGPVLHGVGRLRRHG